MSKIKVIHVHLFNGKKNYYFGSVTAIYKKLTAEEIGCTERYLQQVLYADGTKYLSSKALVIRSTLIRS